MTDFIQLVFTVEVLSIVLETFIFPGVKCNFLCLIFKKSTDY